MHRWHQHVVRSSNMASVWTVGESSVLEPTEFWVSDSSWEFTAWQRVEGFVSLPPLSLPFFLSAPPLFFEKRRPPTLDSPPYMGLLPFNLFLFLCCSWIFHPMSPPVLTHRLFKNSSNIQLIILCGSVLLLVHSHVLFELRGSLSLEAGLRPPDPPFQT